MKIGILTFPLINNFGGILQAFALMQFLKSKGHQPKLIRLENEKYLKSLFKFYIKKILSVFLNKYKDNTLVKQSESAQQFIEKHIYPTTQPINNVKSLSRLFSSEKFDTIIVGSDQVFAKMSYPGFENIYSLGDKSLINTRKISYAASFGAEKYRGNSEEIAYHAENLSKFKAISVREKSGIQICKSLFDVEAVQTVDPTMLLQPSNYDMLLKERHFGGRLFSYILDSSHKIAQFVQTIEKKIDTKAITIKDGNDSKENTDILDWLSGIKNSDYVITDSFHGCLFSIIFNTPFSCIINKDRGSDRFYSLLRELALLDRINCTDPYKTISWDTVNSKVDLLRRDSSEYLVSALNC